MSTFVITMAGLSSRFFKEGYTRPKYQLQVFDESMFAWAVKSFNKYFSDDFFLFVVRDIFDTPSFVRQECGRLGIKNYHICVLDRETLGQAETAYIGLQTIPKNHHDEIVIFNIDSQRKNYVKPDWLSLCDGYLELFVAEGEHWSFAKLNEKNGVLETAEKKRISNLASDGLYYFKNLDIFSEAYLYHLEHQLFEKGELYVAPLYNRLIALGYDIRGYVVSDDSIAFCGTPEEFHQLTLK